MEKSNSESTTKEDTNFSIVSTNIYSYCYDEKLDKYSHIQKFLTAEKEIYKLKPNSKVMFLFLRDYYPECKTVFKKIENVKINLKSPPVLKKILNFCELIFDWLADDKDNTILIIDNNMESIVIMIHSFSRFYDSFSRKDLKLLSSIKKFVNCQTKYLQGSVSYKRYADYMCLYSYTNRLSSLCTSVQLYCINLSYFPNMESDLSNTTDIFFKIYTRDPLQCSHTTKTYPLPTNINRLVILFEHYPISLYDDVMLVAYHRYPITGRQKLFRLNFHCCQATVDMLSFIASDFEDIYPSCPLKMKVDLYFRASAIYGDDHLQSYDESNMAVLSPIQKVDSYSDFVRSNLASTSSCQLSDIMTNSDTKLTDRKKMFDQIDSNKNSPRSKTPQSAPLDKTASQFTDIERKRHSSSSSYSATLTAKIEDYRQDTTPLSIINQRGQLTGPIDSSHTTKLDSVRTSTTALNETEESHQKMNQLMSDLNVQNHSNKFQCGSNGNLNRNINQSQQLLRVNNSHTNVSVVNNREVQLMNELMEAQKEITNLRQSISHLDRETTSTMTATQNNHLNGSVPRPINSNASVFSVNRNNSVSSTSRLPNQMSSSAQLRLNSVPTSPIFTPRTQHNGIQNKATNNTTSYIQQYQSSILPSTGYSAHREKLEKEKSMRSQQQQQHLQQGRPYLTNDKDINNHNNPIGGVTESNDVFEEVETINLQPIGKGIQDLTGSNAPGISSTMNHRGVQGHQHQNFNENMSLHTLSPSMVPRNTLNQNMTMGSRMTMTSPPPTFGSGTMVHNNNIGIPQNVVEEKTHLWYKPHVTRDEAAAQLKLTLPGTFLIRDSNSYVGAYGLAVKVATIPPNVTIKSDDIEAEKVRHYLIEPHPSGNNELMFKGYPLEPSFPSLAALVSYYSHTASVLPCCLVLPEDNHPNTVNHLINPMKYNSPSLISKPTNLSTNTLPQIHRPMNNTKLTQGVHVYYLGSYDVEHYTGPSVINKSIEKLLAVTSPGEALSDARRFTECQLLLNLASGSVQSAGHVNAGIILTDIERKLFFRRHHPFSSIIFCGLDPRDRKLEIETCRARGIKKTKVFGIIVKEYVAGDSKCFLFAELDPNVKSSTIVDSINQNINTAPSMK